MDRSHENTIFQYFLGTVGAEMEFDPFFIPCGQQAVPLEMGDNMRADRIFTKSRALDQQLCIKFVCQHGAFSLSSVFRRALCGQQFLNFLKLFLLSDAEVQPAAVAAGIFVVEQGLRTRPHLPVDRFKLAAA